MICVARQLGHGAELTLRTGSRTLEDSPRLSAEAAILRARETMRGRRDHVRVLVRV